MTRAPLFRRIRATLKIDIWHNLLWSRYKGHVFSKLHELAERNAIDVRFFQIAECDTDRAGLSPVDLDWHRYPFDLLFRGSLTRVSKWQLFRAICMRTWRSDADIAILAGYERPEYWLQAFICLIRRRKIAVFCDSTIYDKPQHPLKGLFKRIFFRLCDGIFCYGQRSGEYVRSHGAAPDKVFIRCQAAALFQHYDPPDIVRRRVDARRAGALRYLYVGRLAPEKCVGDLLHAFGKAAMDQPTAHLVLVGTGPEKDALVALAETLGLSKSVTFAGALHDGALVAEYLKASCLVLPSRSEPWGLVVNEALSCGCPVVVSDRCGCTPELVADNATGFSFRCNDIEDLATKLACIPDVFADAEKSAMTCMRSVAPYKVDAAAENVLNGCRAISNLTEGLSIKST